MCECADCKKEVVKATENYWMDGGDFFCWECGHVRKERSEPPRSCCVNGMLHLGIRGHGVERSGKISSPRY
jgi:hypothetical protein